MLSSLCTKGWQNETWGYRDRKVPDPHAPINGIRTGGNLAQMLCYPYMLSMDPNKEISDKLKKARLKLGLRQIDLAKKANINSNYYAKVERGEAIPTLTTIKKILKALGMKSSEILPF